MNVNAIVPSPVKPLLPEQKAMPAETQLSAPNVTPPLSAKEQLARDFYTREEEPWKKFTTRISHYDGTTTVREMTKEEYLESKRGWSALDLRVMQSQLDKFRNSLIDMRPDLAGVNISYTLGDDAQIKVLDPQQTFNEEQLDWLTKSLNEVPHFRDTVQDHARKIMTLVDHDTETFGNRYKLSLSNFQDVIDYGKIMTVKNQDELNNAWIKQVHEKGELRGERLIDVKA
jgi:hypothetical protein